jgi:hypothetical protein
MDKVSDKLSALVESGQPEKEVGLNVILRRGLDRARVTELAREIAGLSPGDASVKVLPAPGIVMMRGTLGSVGRIADHPDVQWIDQDTEAPIEDLADA